MRRGACTGSLSWCSIGGFALETRCHTGQTIVYDTVNQLNWSVDIRTHSIAQIIERVLKPDWDESAKSRSAPKSDLRRSWWHIGWGRKKPGEETGGDDEERPPTRSKTNVPRAMPEEGCIDCVRWEVSSCPSLYWMVLTTSDSLLMTSKGQSRKGTCIVCTLLALYSIACSSILSVRSMYVGNLRATSRGFVDCLVDKNIAVCRT